MEAKTLKLLFENGGLKGVRVAPYPMVADAWMLSVKLEGGDEEAVTRVRTKNPKVYKSLSAVFSDVRKIGFNRAEVCL